MRKQAIIALLLLTTWPLPGQEVITARRRAAAAVVGPTFVQSSVNDLNSGVPADLTSTFGSGTASGNGAVVYAFWSQLSTPSPATGDITDASGDTFVFIKNVVDATNQGTAAMYLATTVTAGTTAITFNCVTRTVTLLCNGFEGMVVFEVHGGSRVADGSNSINQPGSTSSNADTCTAFTTGTSGDLIVFGATDSASGNTTYTAGTSPFAFTIPANGASVSHLATMEYGTQTTAGSVNPAFTGSDTDTYLGLCMGIK